VYPRIAHNVSHGCPLPPFVNRPMAGIASLRSDILHNGRRRLLSRYENQAGERGHKPREGRCDTRYHPRQSTTIPVIQSSDPAG
jgi:hypothetical protein